jgi:MFS family permease
MEKTKFCPSCGTKQVDHARFCHNCGNYLDFSRKERNEGSKEILPLYPVKDNVAMRYLQAFTGFPNLAVKMLRAPDEVYKKIADERNYATIILVSSIFGVLILSAIFGFIFGLSAGGLSWARIDTIRIPCAFLSGLIIVFPPFKLLTDFFRIPWDLRQSLAIVSSMVMVSLVIITSFSFFTFFAGIASKHFGYFISWITYFFISVSLIISGISFARGTGVAFEIQNSGTLAFLLVAWLFIALGLAAITFGPYAGEEYTSLIQRMISGG